MKRHTYINPAGYMQTRVRGNKGPMYLHRLIMERHLRRRLTPQEFVHHKNHVKTDNRLSNLILMKPGEHSRHHNTKHGLSRTIEYSRMKRREFYWRHREEILPKIRKYAHRYYWKNRDRVLDYWKK